MTRSSVTRPLWNEAVRSLPSAAAIRIGLGRRPPWTAWFGATHGRGAELGVRLGAGRPGWHIECTAIALTGSGPASMFRLVAAI